MSAQHVVKVADCDHGSIDIEQEVLREVCPALPWLNCKTEDAVIAQCADAEALLIMYAPLTRRVLGHLKQCKTIVRYGVGVDTIDLKAAAELGISVSNVPDYGTQEVADHALAMMMCLTRKLIPANRTVKEGHWDFRLMRPVRRLQVQTAGLVGLGRIGRHMARYGKALGMNVLAWSPNLDEARATEGGAHYRTKDELLAQADVVSLHIVLSDRTRGVIGARELGLMKSGAILVNTSRGPLVDEAALIAALEAGTLIAALDVYDREPLPPEHPLRRLANTVLTPHLGYGTRETFAEFYGQGIENVLAFLDGKPIRLLHPDT